jgi:ATPase family AAA domain-containing protein 3A/B
MEMQKEKSAYDDKLAKDRIQYRMQMERAANDENLRKQEESIRRQEALRQATLEYEHQNKLKQDRERMISKFNTKAEVERQNFDLTEKKIKVKEVERRQTSKEIAVVGLHLVGQGLKQFINDKTMLLKVLFGLTGAYVCGYGLKSGINLMYKYSANRIMTPKLIRETSRIPINKSYMYPVKFYNRFLLPGRNDIMQGIILKPDLENQLRIVSNALINRKKHFAPFRNLLFYGPPGTGKTLFAKQLATKSGLDFAIMTGADVAPLGPSAVHELHKIFDWAETSKNGLLIFVDEADAFLRRRTGDELISENLRNAINAFLYRTGSPSNKFMVVLATNAPQLLDEAIQDRIDEMVLFDRPSIKERSNILYHYLLKYCKTEKSIWQKLLMYIKNPTRLFYKIKKINMTQIDTTYIEDIAQRTEGFSGRELNKLVVSWHDATFAKDDPVLDKKIIEEVLIRHIEQNNTKFKWNTFQEEYFKLMHPKL